MKRFTTFGAFFSIMLIAGSVFASGVALTGIGARATALGGNYRAISDDWSAMFWNPAGIAQIKGLHVGGSFELIMPGSKYTFSQYNNIPFSVYKTEEFKNEPKTFPIPAAGFVYGMENNMSFGLSVYAPFGLGAKWDAMNTSAYNSAYPEFEFEDDLKIIDIHPTFAYQADKLSVGFGVSIILADITIRKPTTTPNALIFDDRLALLRGMLQQYQLGSLLSSNFNHILTDSELKGDGIGFGFNFGLKYNLTENLAFGLSGNYYNDVSLDGKLNATTYGAVISQQAFAGYKGILDQALAGQLLSADQYQQLLGIYSGQKIPYYPADTKGDAKLPLPMTLGAGLSFTGINNLLLSADISWTQWSQWETIKIDIEDPNLKDTKLVENWEDGIRVGLGAEYTLLEPLKIRAGYYTEPSAIPDETLTITIPDISRRHSISFGLSYNLGPLSLFSSYEKIFIGDRTVDTWKADESLTGFDNMAGTYKMNVDNVMLGLGYNF